MQRKFCGKYMNKIQYIKDGNGQFIGSQVGNWIRSKNGSQVAQYKEGSNITLTNDAKRFGQGDQRLGALNQSLKKK